MKKKRDQTTDWYRLDQKDAVRPVRYVACLLLPALLLAVVCLKLLADPIPHAGFLAGLPEGLKDPVEMTLECLLFIVAFFLLLHPVLFFIRLYHRRGRYRVMRYDTEPGAHTGAARGDTAMSQEPADRAGEDGAARRAHTRKARGHSEKTQETGEDAAKTRDGGARIVPFTQEPKRSKDRS